MKGYQLRRQNQKHFTISMIVPYKQVDIVYNDCTMKKWLPQKLHANTNCATSSSSASFFFRNGLGHSGRKSFETHRLHIHSSRSGDSGRETPFSSAATGAKATIKGATKLGGIFKANQAPGIDRYRLAVLEVLEDEGSTRVQKGHTTLRPLDLLSAASQTGTAPTYTAAIEIASNVDVAQFGHVRTGLQNHVSSGCHMCAEFDGNHLWIIQ